MLVRLSQADVRLLQARSINKPVELVISVHVLSGPEGVGDSLHDGAGKVIGGVHLVLGLYERLGLSSIHSAELKRLILFFSLGLFGSKIQNAGPTVLLLRKILSH